MMSGSANGGTTPENETAVDVPEDGIPVEAAPVESRRRGRWKYLRRWFLQTGYGYATSALVHLIGLTLFALMAMLLPDVVRYVIDYSEGTLSLDPVDGLREPIPFDIGFSDQRPELGGELDLSADAVGGDVSTGVVAALLSPDVMEEWNPGGAGPAVAWYDANLPGGGFEGINEGPSRTGDGLGSVFGDGTGKFSGEGGDGYGLRRSGGGGGPGGVGNTDAAQKSVEAALWWLYRHQANDGHWSLDHSRQCKDGGCDGGSMMVDDVGATALAILPFLGAGQTHTERCRYQQVVANALKWLVRQQEPDGRIVGKSPKKMYSHAIATTAICEAYGMTGDPTLREPAERAIRFIEWAQHPRSGGWRYEPHDEGDLSVTAWQVMALHSGNMAGVHCNTENFERTRTFLDIVADGAWHGIFRYRRYEEVTPGRTAMGILCLQYLGERPDTKRYAEGKEYLIRSWRDPDFFPLSDGTAEAYMARRDIYSWYYITLVLHNTLDRDWDAWNHAMRRELIGTQCRSDGCDFGSWSPTEPSRDAWGVQGGRLMMTAMSALNLEIYYRYLPLFRTTTNPVARIAGDIP